MRKRGRAALAPAVQDTLVCGSGGVRPSPAAAMSRWQRAFTNPMPDGFATLLRPGTGALRAVCGATPKTAIGTGALPSNVPAGRPMAVWGGRTGQRALESSVPMNPTEFEDAKLLWKMFYAGQCFMHAQAAAEYVLQKNIEGNNPVYYPLVTAVYTLYGKPFLTNYGVGSLSDEIIPPECLELHRTIMD